MLFQGSVGRAGGLFVPFRGGVIHLKRFLYRHWLDLLILILFIAGIALIVYAFYTSHDGVPDIVVLGYRLSLT